MAEYAEFNKTTEFTDHLKALDNRFGISRRLDIDITTIPIGKILDDCLYIIFGRIQAKFGTKALGQCQTVIIHIDDNKFLGRFQRNYLSHAQTQRTSTRQNYYISPVNITTSNRVNCTGHRLNQSSILK